MCQENEELSFLCFAFIQLQSFQAEGLRSMDENNHTLAGFALMKYLSAGSGVNPVADSQAMINYLLGSGAL